MLACTRMAFTIAAMVKGGSNNCLCLIDCFFSRIAFVYDWTRWCIMPPKNVNERCLTKAK